MTTSVPLNMAETVWVTTFYGGQERGTCFDVSVRTGEDTQVTATFTLEEFATLVKAYGQEKTFAKPAFH